MKVRPLAPEDADQDPDAAPVYSKDDAERLRLGSGEPLAERDLRRERR